MKRRLLLRRRLDTDVFLFSFSIFIELNKGLIAAPLSVLEALVFKVDENIHPWTSTYLKIFIPGCSSTCVQSTVYRLLCTPVQSNSPLHWITANWFVSLHSTKKEEKRKKEKEERKRKNENVGYKLSVTFGTERKMRN